MPSDKLTSEEVIKLVCNVIGSIHPVGDSRIDADHFDNLLIMIDLTDWCIAQIHHASLNKYSEMGSVRAIGKRASKAERDIHLDTEQEEE